MGLQDRALCSHVLSVHQTGRAPERTDAVELLDAATLRSYIAKAKQFNPYIPEDLTGVHPCQQYALMEGSNHMSRVACSLPCVQRLLESSKHVSIAKD